jgi:hypothetical protein
MKKAPPNTVHCLAILIFAVAITTTDPNPILPSVAAESTLPQVELNADGVGPRQIEPLTSQVVPRDYAYAWQTMSEAMDNNRDDLLDGYFTGWAKENLSNLIADQKRTGVHTSYVDHGHKLTALFYSPAGDAMQLRDQARLEMQVFDGQKLIDSEQITVQYLVLMTPGADRWLVRDLETVPEVEH